MAAELDQSTDQNRLSSLDPDEGGLSQSVFEVKRTDLPPRTELKMDVIKLLERLSLVDFGTEKSLIILEEAIRYADPLLTQTAYRGTTNDNRWSPDNVEPLYSLCEELYSNHSCPLESDLADSNSELAKTLFSEVPNSWESYIVTPPGNIPIEPRGVERSTVIADHQ